MKYCKLFILLFCVNFSLFAQDSKRVLFPFQEHDLWGFIDAKGEVIVKPVYEEASNFYDGLAKVRLDGYFGYIDATGKLVIKNQFDVAHEFYDGIALVFKKQKQYYIDTKGDFLFEHNFIKIDPFLDKKYTVVVTEDYKRGIIDREGKLILKSLSGEVSIYEKGIIRIKRNTETGTDYSIINLKGEVVVPFGTYDKIYWFRNGFAYVEKKNSENPKENDFVGFIDEAGNLLKIPTQKWDFSDYPSFYYAKRFYEGLAKVNMYKKDPAKIKSWDAKNANTYLGIIDSKGTIIKSDTTWDNLSYFNKGRAYVKRHRKFQMINSKGNYVNDILYDAFAPSFDYEMDQKIFENSDVYVAIDESWGMVNRDGEFTIKPSELLKDINYKYIQQFGDYLVYVGYDGDRKYGFANLKNNVATKIAFDGIDVETLNDDLIHVLIGERNAYVNQQGEILYIDKFKINLNDYEQFTTVSIEETLQKLNIVHHEDVDYKVGSFGNVPVYRNHGGWSPSNNLFKKITSLYNFKPNSLDVVVDDERIEAYKEEHKGYKLYISNKTNDSIFFKAYNSSLDMVLQAKDTDGSWKDIQRSYNSPFNVSIHSRKIYVFPYAYHQLYLLPNTYWELIIPKYHGAIKTKLRTKLSYVNKKTNEEEIIYSNEFQGSVNPAQFWYQPYKDNKMKPCRI